MIKRQGSIASSIYAAQLSALRTVIEEAQHLRCMLYCIGYKLPSDVLCPTYIFRDNLSATLNT